MTAPKIPIYPYTYIYIYIYIERERVQLLDDKTKLNMLAYLITYHEIPFDLPVLILLVTLLNHSINIENYDYNELEHIELFSVPKKIKNMAQCRRKRAGGTSVH